MWSYAGSFDGVVFHQAQVKINAKHPCLIQELSMVWLAVCFGPLRCSSRLCPVLSLLAKAGVFGEVIFKSEM